MADSPYKSLYIALGADTSNISRALKNLNTQINSTQRYLRQLDTALKLDPTSMTLLATRSELDSKKLVTLAQKIEVLRQQEAELGNSAGVRRLADQMQNVGVLTVAAQTKLREYETRLNAVKREVEELAAANNIAYDKDHVIQSIDALERLGIKVSATTAEYKKLASAYNEAMEERKILNQAQNWETTRVKIALAESELKQFASSITTVAANSQKLATLKTRLEQSDTTIETLNSHIKALDSNIRLLSTSKDKIQLLHDKMKLVTEETAELNTKVTTLREKLASLKDAAGDKVYLSMKELAVQTTRVADELTQARIDCATLETNLVNAKTAVQVLEAESRDVGEPYENARADVVRLSNELEEARARVNALEAEGAQLKSAFDLTRVNTELAETAAKMTSLDSAANRTNSSVRALGITMSAVLTGVVYMALYRSIDAARDLDEAFRSMKKTVAGTEEQYEALYNAAVKYSQTHITSAEEILEIEALGGQLGIAAENLESFATVVSNLDIATDIDAETAATEIGQLSNQMGWAIEDAEHFSDALVRLGNNLPAQESKIVEITGRISSMGSIVGFTGDQLLAWAAAMASTTQGAEAAGTAFSKTMSAIESAVASGGDKLSSFASIAGMSAEEFATAWNTAPSDAMYSFVAGLKKVDESGGSVDATLQSLSITGVRQKETLSNLTQTLDVLTDAQQMSADAWAGLSDEWGNAGDAAYEAQQKSEGFYGAIETLTNSASNLGAEFMYSLTPILQTLSSLLNGLYDIVSGMPDGFKRWTVITAAIVAVSGPLLNLTAAVKNMSGGMSKAEIYTQKFATKLGFVKDETGSYTKAVKAETTAQTANTAATETATAAAKTKAAATETVAEAEEFATVATKATTSATKYETAQALLASVANKAMASSLTAAGAAASVFSTALKAIPGVLIFTMLATGIEFLTNAISSATNETSELKDKFNDLEETAQDLKDAMDDANESIAKAGQQSDDIGALAQAFAAAAQGADDTAETNTELLAIQTQLAGVSDELSASLFDNGQAVALTADEVSRLAKAEQARIKNQAKIDAFTELYDKQQQAASDLEQAQSDLLELQQLYDEEAKKSIEIQGAGITTTNKYERALLDAKQRVQELADAYGTSVDEMQSWLDGVEAQALKTQALSEACERVQQGEYSIADAAEYVNGVLSSAGISLGEYGVSLDEMGQEAQYAATSLDDDLMEALEALEEELDEACESNALFAAALDGSGISSDRLCELLNATGTTVDDFVTKIEDAVSQTTDAWNRMTVEEGHTLEAYQENLRANIEAMQNWNDNLATILQAVIDTGDASMVEFVQTLSDGGYEANADMIAALAQGIRDNNGAVTPAMQETYELYKQAVDEGARGVAERMNIAGAQAADAYNSSLTESLRNTDAAVAAVNNAISTLSSNTTASWKQAGKDAAEGYIAGFISDSRLVYDAGFSLAKKALSGVTTAQNSSSPSKETAKLGQYFGQGYAEGIASTESLVSRTASGMAQAALASGRTWQDAQVYTNAIADALYSAQSENGLAQNILDMKTELETICAQLSFLQSINNNITSAMTRPIEFNIAGKRFAEATASDTDAVSGARVSMANRGLAI